MADLSQSGSYRKVVQSPAPPSWRKKIANFFQQTWYFERLLIVLVCLVAPLLALNVYDAFVSGFEMSAEAAKVAQNLRRIKERAHELNTFGILEGKPAGGEGQSAYLISYEDSQMGVLRVPLPKGISLVGSVRFDPQGVPERPAVLKLRHGLKYTDVLISVQGAISIP